MQYTWKSGSRVKADAQMVGEICADLESRRMLTPANLVDEGRPDGSPLHGLFEWDDSVAAERYRETQAAYIIRSIEVVSSGHEPVRAFVSISIGGTAREYMDVNAVVSSADTREMMLADALADLIAFKRKYKALKEFEPIFDVIDEMEKQYDTKQNDAA